MKPVLVDPAKVRPRVDADACRCAKCGQKRARWYVLAETEDGVVWAPTCSWCVFYDSGWGEKNAEGLADLIAATEKHLKRGFHRQPDGKLVSSADTDRILSSISLTSRIFAAADKRGG